MWPNFRPVGNPAQKKTLRRLNNIPASGKGMNAQARLIKFNGSSSDGARGETGWGRQCNGGGGGSWGGGEDSMREAASKKRQNEKGERQRKCAPLWEVETNHYLALSVYLFSADGVGGGSVTVHVDSRASLLYT
jgi:hypothetical protein